jgi:hypothetical protein
LGEGKLWQVNIVKLARDQLISLNKKALYDENYEKIWGSKKNKLYEERYYDSDETTSWDQDKVDMIGLNNNTGDHYIK